MSASGRYMVCEDGVYGDGDGSSPHANGVSGRADGGSVALVRCLDIETWCREVGWSYRELADRLDMGDWRSAKRLAIGAVDPPVDVVDRVVALSGGRVAWVEVIARRRRWLSGATETAVRRPRARCAAVAR